MLIVLNGSWLPSATTPFSMFPLLPLGGVNVTACVCVCGLQLSTAALFISLEVEGG